MTDPIARLDSLVFDCPDPDRLATFWQTVLNYRPHRRDPEWVTIADATDSTRRLSFQRVDDYRPPTWPDDQRPQQVHLDLLVSDLPVADQQVLAAGATHLSEVIVHEDETFRVFADPAGHPFCLIQSH